ncbi:MAG: DUF2283 domain-containing protein [Chloroflexi bacterium]|nr:DUF2283 domain-containing protein [Chloroflexota bacterium]
MKLNYNRADDVLIIETDRQGSVDHAEQTGSMIAHFDLDNQLLFLEVLDASAFIASLVQVALRSGEPVPLAAAGS